MDMSDVDVLQLIFDTLRDYWKYEWDSVPMPDYIVLSRPMFRELYKWTAAHKRHERFKILGIQLGRDDSDGAPDIALAVTWLDGAYRCVWPYEIRGQFMGEFKRFDER